MFVYFGLHLVSLSTPIKLLYVKKVTVYTYINAHAFTHTHTFHGSFFCVIAYTPTCATRTSSCANACVRANWREMKRVDQTVYNGKNVHAEMR